MVDALWSLSNPLSDRRAALGITRAVQRLLGWAQKAPQVWSRLQGVLASLPESGVGFIADSFGLGYGALPYAIAARIRWLVAQRYVEYVPGKGLLVHWERLGTDDRPELVPV